jgi:hypothetical protein
MWSRSVKYFQFVIWLVRYLKVCISSTQVNNRYMSMRVDRPPSLQPATVACSRLGGVGVSGPLVNKAADGTVASDRVGSQRSL